MHNETWLISTSENELDYKKCSIYPFSFLSPIPWTIKQMCGFTAYLQMNTISKDGDTVAPVLDLGGALDLINHRGPDARGIYISPDGRCGKKRTAISLLWHGILNAFSYDYKRAGSCALVHY